METHLSEMQLFEALLGNTSPRVEAHLASCAECRARFEQLRAATAALGTSARGQAEKPEAFWAQQRSAVAARRARPSVSPLAWAAAIAVAILAAMLLQEPRPATPATPATDPDQELLVEVERATRRQVPQALEPATVLTQEISRNVKPTVPARQSKGEPQ